MTAFMYYFSDAEKYGPEAVKDVFNKAFKELKKDVASFSEFARTISIKAWAWSGTDNELAYVYESLWEKADNYAMTHFKGTDLKYYMEMVEQ